MLHYVLQYISQIKHIYKNKLLRIASLFLECTGPDQCIYTVPVLPSKNLTALYLMALSSIT